MLSKRGATKFEVIRAIVLDDSPYVLHEPASSIQQPRKAASSQQPAATRKQPQEQRAHLRCLGNVARRPA